MRILHLMIISTAILTSAALYIILPTILDPSESPSEPFPNELSVELLDDGRSARLLSDYVFRDPQNRTWTTPAGYVSDGASIPRVVWGLTGGPFSGKYRNAAIIHDRYCDTQNRPWEQVHRVFYDGMIANGVDERKAAIMYLSVYRFGPRWDDSFTVPCPPFLSCVEPEKVSIPYYSPQTSNDTRVTTIEGTLKAIEKIVNEASDQGTIDVDSSFDELKRHFDDEFAMEYRDWFAAENPTSDEVCEQLASIGVSLSDYARACGGLGSE